MSLRPCLALALVSVSSTTKTYVGITTYSSNNCVVGTEIAAMPGARCFHGECCGGDTPTQSMMATCTGSEAKILHYSTSNCAGTPNLYLPGPAANPSSTSPATCIPYPSGYNPPFPGVLSMRHDCGTVTSWLYYQAYTDNMCSTGTTRTPMILFIDNCDRGSPTSSEKTSFSGGVLSLKAFTSGDCTGTKTTYTFSCNTCTYYSVMGKYVQIFGPADGSGPCPTYSAVTTPAVTGPGGGSPGGGNSTTTKKPAGKASGAVSATAWPALVLAAVCVLGLGW